MKKASRMALFRSLFVLTLLGVLWQNPLFAATEPGPAPRELVITTSNDLIDALQKHKDEIKQDMDLAYRIAEDTVIPHLDFPRITRWVLGKHWRAASEDQRQRLTEEFRTLLIRSYVTSMVTYVDQILQNADNVQYPPERSHVQGETAAVTMVISLENAQQAVVKYEMYQTEAGWKIFDVQVEGVSLALTYRSTFSQEISQKGIDGLITTLAVRNDEDPHQPRPELTP